VSGGSQEEEEEERKSDGESIPPGDSSPPVNRNAEQQVCGHVSASPAQSSETQNTGCPRQGS